MRGAQLILFLICFSVASSLWAQRSGSPYSYFGIGIVNQGNTVEASTMQGISMYRDSLQVNLKNPASYGELAPVSFTLGGIYTNTSIQTPIGKGNAGYLNITNIGLSVPVNQRLAFGAGLIPYSTVRYSFSSTTDTEVNTREGRGGINQFFFSGGYKISKNFSVGATFKYNFGQITSSDLVILSSIAGLATNRDDSSTITGSAYEVGVKYRGYISKGYSLDIGVSYSPEILLNASNTTNISLSRFSVSGVRTDSSTTAAQEGTARAEERKRGVTIPQNLTFGIGFGKTNKWFIGAEYRYNQVSRFSFPFTRREEATYKDAGTYVLGGFYTPDSTPFSRFFRRISYRGGISYSNTGLVLGQTPINQLEVSVGAGLPVSVYNKVNILLSYSLKGQNRAGVLREDSVSLGVGFTFTDIWFIKRKFN